MSLSPGVLIAVGGNQYTKANIVEYYDSEANVWINAFDIDADERSQFNSIVFGGKLILLGGEKSYRYVTTVTSYDFENDETSILPSFSTKAVDMSVAVVSGHLYIMGGFDSAYLDRVERYSPFTNKWETVAPMLKARYNCAAAVLNGEIYLIGGFRYVQLTDVDVYNPTDDSWRQCAPMNEKRLGPSVATVGGFIYAAGYSESNIAERYDPVVDKWTYIESYDVYRSFGSGTSFNNSFVFAGGYNYSKDEIGEVESYDPENNKWTTLSSLNVPRVLFDIVKVPWSGTKPFPKVKASNYAKRISQ